MELNIINRQEIIEYNEKIKELLYKVVEKAFELEGLDKNQWEVSISFVDNNEIQLLNKTYRGIDKPTDVLSFPQYNNIDEIMEEDDSHRILGDIVISLEKAKEQSREYGHSFEREVAFLTSHSMLHLFGYDHDTDENTKKMRSKEEKVLEMLGILR